MSRRTNRNGSKIKPLLLLLGLIGQTGCRGSKPYVVARPAAPVQPARTWYLSGYAGSAKRPVVEVLPPVAPLP